MREASREINQTQQKIGPNPKESWTALEKEEENFLRRICGETQAIGAG